MAVISWNPVMHVFMPETAVPSTIPRVLIVDGSEAASAEMLHTVQSYGMTAARVSSGAAAVAMKEAFHPDVILMDLQLSDGNGVDLISHFTERRSCGVILVSARHELSDCVVALELGADDFIAKPPPMREVIARIRSVHRRVNRQKAAQSLPTSPEALKVGPIRVNTKTRVVTGADGIRIDLTAAQFEVLQCLLEARGAPVTRDMLSTAALRREWRPDDRSIDQLVFTLRNKLPKDVGESHLIHSIRNVGYSMRVPDYH